MKDGTTVGWSVSHPGCLAVPAWLLAGWEAGTLGNLPDDWQDGGSRPAQPSNLTSPPPLPQTVDKTGYGTAQCNPKSNGCVRILGKTGISDGKNAFCSGAPPSFVPSCLLYVWVCGWGSGVSAWGPVLHPHLASTRQSSLPNRLPGVLLI